MDAALVYNLFSAFGEIIQVYATRNNPQGEYLAFVQFVELASVQRAIRSWHGIRPPGSERAPVVEPYRTCDEMRPMVSSVAGLAAPQQTPPPAAAPRTPLATQTPPPAAAQQTRCSLRNLLMDAAKCMGMVEELMCCPITSELFVDPVTTEDGITYERIDIEAWLKNHDTSPLTNEVLSCKKLVPNTVLQKIIAELAGAHALAGKSGSSAAAAAATPTGTSAAEGDSEAVPVPVPIPVPVPPAPAHWYTAGTASRPVQVPGSVKWLPQMPVPVPMSVMDQIRMLHMQQQMQQQQLRMGTSS